MFQLTKEEQKVLNSGSFHHITKRIQEEYELSLNGLMTAAPEVVMKQQGRAQALREIVEALKQ